MSAECIGELSLFDIRGQRKYLTDAEGRRFEDAARRRDRQTAAFCLLLSYAGCRISEALELVRARIDPDRGCVILRTLKRRRLTYRAVPLPDFLLSELLAIDPGSNGRLFPWCRQTGWRRIKTVLDEAGVAGPHAVPKGLRHRFGIRAAEANIPTAVTQRWMGHANAKSTAIYQQVVGVEERRLAARMWT